MLAAWLGRLTRIPVFTTLFLAATALAGLQSATPSPGPPTTADSSTSTASAPDDRLIRVVALFRHGVRAPLTDLNEPAPSKKPRYSKALWPSLSDWEVEKWGDLTPHGADLARALGRDYADTYKRTWTSGFKAYLWADNERRTQATFTGGCGVPSAKHLLGISSSITVDSPSWIAVTYAERFERLYDVLACPDDSTQCAQLSKVEDNSAGYCPQADGCGSAPITWKGQFPYANTASETFLLEYANNMDPANIGWGQLWQPPPHDTRRLSEMLPLHEFYFDQTQRDPYLAKIQASNLVRELRQALNEERVGCRRIPNGYQFAALVGHDTNIAGVATLLGLSWQFTDAPDGTRGIPDNDPLPTGALVFELRQGTSGPFVRISYAAQGLREMRNCPSAFASCPGFRLPVRCDTYSTRPGACDLPIHVFNHLATGALGAEFLSGCRGGQQVCGVPRAP